MKKRAQANQSHLYLFHFSSQLVITLEGTTVNFGGKDSNEDHHHLGQLVTQHCRSYVFTIDTQTKLRLIDTPGLEDTRSHDQDDFEIRNIYYHLLPIYGTYKCNMYIS